MDLHDQLRPHLAENEQSRAQHRNPRHALSNDHHGYDSSYYRVGPRRSVAYEDKPGPRVRIIEVRPETV
jgi:hypothetical protein